MDMTEQVEDNQEIVDTSPDTGVSELAALKTLADNMGLTYHNNIGVEKLKAKIEEAREATSAGGKATSEPAATGALTRNERHAEMRKDALKLVRVIVVSMNPNRKEWTSEYFGVSNKVVGTVKKLVPYGVEWHVPQILVDMIKARKFRTSIEKPDGKGGKVRENRILNEFSVQELPPLSKEELESLAKEQAARGSIDRS